MGCPRVLFWSLLVIVDINDLGDYRDYCNVSQYVDDLALYTDSVSQLYLMMNKKTELSIIYEWMKATNVPKCHKN